jgi:hypothetical protein
VLTKEHTFTVIVCSKLLTFGVLTSDTVCQRITAQREGPALNTGPVSNRLRRGAGVQSVPRSQLGNARKVPTPPNPTPPQGASAAKKNKARRAWHTPGPSQGGKRPSLGDQAAAYEDQASSVPQRPPSGGAGRRRRTGMARERAVRSRGRPITGPAGARSATPRLSLTKPPRAWVACRGCSTRSRV